MSEINRTDVIVNLTDATGNTINDKVVILFNNQRESGLSQPFEVTFHGTPEILSNIPSFPMGRANVIIKPNIYRSKSIFKNVFGSSQPYPINETFFVAPDKAHPKLIDFADIATKPYGDDLARILSNSGINANAWNSLDKRNRATIFNLSAKMFREKTSSNQRILELVESIMPERLNRPNRARVFARVNSNLIEELRQFPVRFNPAPGISHHFPASWNSFGNNSFKSRDEAGNIQFTFATNNDGLFLADIDLDDHSGIKHAFDVIHHAVTGVDTDPYDIHQILIHFQGLDPGYQLL